MTLSLLFLLSCIGACAAYIAKKKGRRPFLWFWIGFIFGIVGLVVELCLFFLVPLFQTKKALPPAPSRDLPPVYAQNSLWYYLTETKERIGPVSFELLQKKKSEGTIGPLTYLWNESLPDWKLLKELFPETCSPE